MKKSIILMMMLTACLWAHGVNFDLVNGDEVMLLSFSYTGAEAVTYGEVSVFGPTDTDVEYQSGRTDRLGYFAFYPQSEGLWLVQIDDGQQHTAAAKVLVKKEKDTFVGELVR